MTLACTAALNTGKSLQRWRCHPAITDGAWTDTRRQAHGVPKQANKRYALLGGSDVLGQRARLERESGGTLDLHKQAVIAMCDKCHTDAIYTRVRLRHWRHAHMGAGVSVGCRCGCGSKLVCGCLSVGVTAGVRDRTL